LEALSLVYLNLNNQEATDTVNIFICIKARKFIGSISDPKAYIQSIKMKGGGGFLLLPCFALIFVSLPSENLVL